MTGCTNVPPPKSLKETLEFAGALSSQGLGNSVGKELQRRVKEYAEKIDVASNFTSTLDRLQQLREKLVHNSGTYGSYANLSSQPVCLAHTVSASFPKLYCTLCYFNFNINGENYGGWGWKSKQCSDSQGLSTWLTSGNEIPSVSGQNSSATIWRGGGVKCSNTSEFSSQLKDCVEDNGSKFPMLLSGILFLQPSHPELTSTFLMLVKEICIIVCGNVGNDAGDGEHGRESRKKLCETFKSQYGSVPDYGSLNACCSSLKSSIEQLVGKESGGDETSPLRIPNSSHKLYENKLQSKHFPNYLQWLSQNLPSLIENLNLMKADCTSWDSQNMSEGQASGPFPYGFGFSIKWSNGQEVQSTIHQLTDEGPNHGLPALRGHVKKLIASSTSSSAGSIAGGLLGTAAVGGTGAAVALNAGGVTTALKGAIGIFK
ncbi:secreted antigen 1 [Babesia caballi]|uniref:Secreted antigen 1 n=1 Tax=Babesia caballi TaxID=5871 RepID=A0AAV4LW96_BABCB|nr:secreted antigen 1 [Babesia caballi]